jgi:oligopeptide/dipeptide ABC transporter ATP-binding protein
MQREIVLETKNVKKYFYSRDFFGSGGTIYAVDGVNLQIRRMTTLGLIGESGSGKTTFGKTAIDLIPATGGEIFFDTMNVLNPANAKEKDEIRRKMQIVFQDPFGSLNPWMTIGDSISRPIAIHKLRPRREKTDRVRELLELVELDKTWTTKYPHELSGGQRQRVAIARALANEPEFILLDEATSALDVSVQGKILNLLMKLQKELGLTYLFISHNMSVITNVSDAIAVMYLGKIVEMMSQKCINETKHPYTRALLSAVPRADPAKRTKRIILAGSIPSPANPPKGCKFHTRCQYAVDRCKREEPELLEIHDGHLVACHRWREIQFPAQ